MTETVKLDSLRPGDGCVIVRVCHSESAMEHRLGELGFTAGSRAECVGRSPFGGMSAYLVRGAVIALRDSDAASIQVTLTER